MDKEFRDYEEILDQYLTPEEKEEFQNTTEQMVKFLNVKDREDRALKLLGEKYKEEFEILQYCGQKFPDNYFEVNAYSKDYPDLVFKAQVDLQSDIIADTYAVRRTCQNFSDYLNNRFDFSENYFRFYVESYIYYINIPDSKYDFRQLMKDYPKNQFNVYLFLELFDSSKMETLKDSISRLFNDLESFSGDVIVYSLSVSQKKEIEAYLSSRPRIFTDFIWDNEQYCLGKFKIVNGRIKESSI